MKPIVAFLQNPWFKPGTSPRSIKMFQEDPEFRKRVILLSMTGKLLYSAFGSDLYHHIWWDEANPEPCFNSRDVKHPDKWHITRVIDGQNPEIVISFGSHACHAVADVLAGFASLPFPGDPSVHLKSAHPCARGKHRPDLNLFAERVRHLAT